jgi:hypothetical protein
VDALPPDSSPSPPTPPAFEAPSTTVEVIRDTSLEPRPVERGPLELGLGGFLLSGGPAGGYSGITAFFLSDWGQGVFVRPSLLFGQSTGSPVSSTLGGLRVDVCTRLQGNYVRGSGIQLDLCGGTDAGWAVLQPGTLPGDPTSSLGMPYIHVGPSVDLRAELGRAAITLRTVAGFDVTQSSYVDVTGARVYAPMWPLRIELAVSWDAGGAGG